MQTVCKKQERVELDELLVDEAVIGINFSDDSSAALTSSHL